MEDTAGYVGLMTMPKHHWSFLPRGHRLFPQGLDSRYFRLRSPCSSLWHSALLLRHKAAVNNMSTNKTLLKQAVSDLIRELWFAHSYSILKKSSEQLRVTNQTSDGFWRKNLSFFPAAERRKLRAKVRTPECHNLLFSVAKPWLFETPWTVACQVPWSMGSSRQACWNGLPFLSPGDLPNPGIEPRSPAL